MPASTAADMLDHLKSLHTGAVDARNGYEDAIEDAKGQGLTPLFTKMTGLHQKHADELAAALHGAGQPADDDGAFMSAVHRTFINIRALFGGFNQTILPALIDGETRNVAAYNKALDETGLPADIRALLTRQRDALLAAMHSMRTQAPPRC
jgi:uncharacterized protein (TIGR02284 family)